jgi:hypothetical protein
MVAKMKAARGNRPAGLTSTTTPAGIAAHDPEVSPLLTVDPEFKAYLRMLTEDEQAQLLASLLRDGCRDPLVVWDETGILVDGHHRKELCEANEIGFSVVRKSFANREAALAWIQSTQLGRRNLTPAAYAYELGRKLEAEKGKRGGDRKSKAQVEPLISAGKNGHASKPKGGTAARIAKEHNISPATVKRMGIAAKAVDRLGGPGSMAGRKILRGDAGMSATAAMLILDAPADQVKEIAGRIAGGKHKSVDAALKATCKNPIHDLTKPSKRTNDQPGFSIGRNGKGELVAKSANPAELDQNEDWATVENRLVEMLEIKDRKRVDAAIRELLVFARARK